MKSQLSARPLWGGVHTARNSCNEICDASTWHKAMVGLQSREWPWSGSQGPVIGSRQGEMAKDAKITIQGNGGCVTREFRS